MNSAQVGIQLFRDRKEAGLGLAKRLGKYPMLGSSRVSRESKNNRRISSESRSMKIDFIERGNQKLLGDKA